MMLNRLTRYEIVEPKGSEPDRLDGHTLRVTCPECGKTFARLLDDDELENVKMLYGNGGFHPDGHVRDIFPEWSAEERELFLQSHICSLCRDTMFGVEPPEGEL